MVIIGHNPILNLLMYKLTTKGHNKLPTDLVTCGVVMIEYSENNFKIDYVLKDIDEVWGSDDDTDIEYMYQYLLNFYETSILTPSQIRAGWLKHIKKEEENFLWVSNQRAFDLMIEGIFPPETSDPSLNENFEMIDAQLTTEIFGLFLAY